MTPQQTGPQARAARPAGPNLTRIHARVDMALGGLLAVTIASAYLDKSAHSVLGSATLVAATVHLALHWRWIAATTRRLTKLPARTQRSLALVLALLLTFVPLVLSGTIVALIYAPQVSAFHTTSFYVFTALVLLHLVLCWRWIAARLRRREHSW